MQHQALDDILSTLDVGLKAFALCEIGADWRLSVDPLDTVIFHFVLRGHGYLEFSGRRVPISAGTIVIVPPGARKSISGPDKVRREVSATDICESRPNGLQVFRAGSEPPSLVLGCATLKATCGGSLGFFRSLREPLFASLSGNALFASGFDPLVQELTQPNIGAMVVAECLVKQSLVLLLREQQRSGNHHFAPLGDARLLRAAAAMVNAPSERHGIESLAALCGMSRSSFMTHFVREYRKTPGEFLQTVRLQAAAALLGSSKMPIKWIAARVGYASRSQFSRSFKLAFGSDPSKYRTQYSSIMRSPVREMALNSDVFITDTLATRPAKREDFRREKFAIQQLADRMADDPADLLPHFVALAMELTDAASAGLSIFDARRAPDVFEWRYLHGLLAPFESATTPRNDSPCGATLDANRPMLLSHPERIYKWIAAEGLVIPEVLLVPLYIAGEALGTLWVVSPDEEHFDQCDARVLAELATFVGIALKMQRSNEDVSNILRKQDAVIREKRRQPKNPLLILDPMVQNNAGNAEIRATQECVSS